MSITILMVAGALRRGMLSAVVPLGRKPDLDTSEAAAFEFESEFFDVGDPVIDLGPTASSFIISASDTAWPSMSKWFVDLRRM